ncbi:hypothetical protein M422DRAFT_247073 [Sphaerobolus stellatus SS14]|nr:hypothetical protein M422DRAFT_247073 [Sphaerobolus stellatus SS14]
MSKTATTTTTTTTMKTKASSAALNHMRSVPPIVALPSMSSGLSTLPNARSLDKLPIHPTLSTQRHTESEAKLLKALERNVQRGAGHPGPPQYPHYSEPNSPASHSPPLMMRSSRPKPKC